MIKDLNQEGKVSLLCLITKADIGRTNKNAPYLSLTLEDSSGVLDAKYWNLTEEQSKLYKAGMVVKATGDLISFKNAWQLRVRGLEIQEDADVTDYVRQAPMDRHEMEEQINAIVDGMKDDTIRTITQKLLDQNKDKYYTWPAAVRNHHNFPGGLAYHSLTMANLAKPVLEQYEFLDGDLLMAGILLHDMAKTEELSAAILPEYTNAGNLVGHISMMNNDIDRIAVQMGVEDSEEVMLLKHMILSHHGKMEFGSPVLPMIPEAEVLTLLDNLDARMFMIHQALEPVAPGHFGPRVFALDNRMFYRRTKDATDSGNVSEPDTGVKKEGEAQ